MSQLRACAGRCDQSRLAGRNFDSPVAICLIAPKLQRTFCPERASGMPHPHPDGATDACRDNLRPLPKTVISRNHSDDNRRSRRSDNCERTDVAATCVPTGSQSGWSLAMGVYPTGATTPVYS